MNNKKGFTLVELIAVIVVLSIVITISSLSIVSIQGKLKEKKKDRLLKVIKVSAEKYVEDTGLKKVYIDTLIKEGYITADLIDKSGEKVILNPIDNTPLNCYYYDFTDKTNSFKSGNCNPDLVSDAVLNIRYCTGNSCNPNNEVPNIWINNSNVYLGVVSSYIDIIDDPSTTYTWISPLAPDVLYSGKNYKVVLPSSNYVDEVYEVTARNNGKNYTVKARVRIDAAKPKVVSVSIDNAEGFAREKIISAKLTDLGSGIAAYMINTSSSAPSAGASGWTTISNNPKEYMVSNYNVLENGTYYVWVKDVAGNINAPGGNSIIVKNIDRTPPICIISGDSTTWTKDNRTISYGCSDNVSGCSKSNSGGSIEFSTTIKIGVIPSYIIKDVAGNETTCEAQNANVYVDKTDPACGTINVSGTSGTNGWYRSNVTISKTNGSDNHSGHASTMIDKDKIENETTTSGEVVTLTTTDKAGNTCTTSKTIKIDKTNPTCGKISISGTSGTNGWYTSSVTISKTNGSDELSGHASTTIDKTSIKKNTTSSGKKVTLTTTDKAGNTCTTSKTIKIDKTAPTCTIEKSNTGTTTGVTVDVQCEDSNSGCDNINETNVTLSKTYTVTDKAGNKGSCAVTIASSNCNCQQCNSKTCMSDGWGYCDKVIFDKGQFSGSNECYAAGGSVSNDGKCIETYKCCKKFVKVPCNCQTCYS